MKFGLFLVSAMQDNPKKWVYDRIGAITATKLEHEK